MNDLLLKDRGKQCKDDQPAQRKPAEFMLSTKNNWKLNSAFYSNMVHFNRNKPYWLFLNPFGFITLTFGFNYILLESLILCFCLPKLNLLKGYIWSYFTFCIFYIILFIIHVTFIHWPCIRSVPPIPAHLCPQASALSKFLIPHLFLV